MGEQQHVLDQRLEPVDVPEQGRLGQLASLVLRTSSSETYRSAARSAAALIGSAALAAQLAVVRHALALGMEALRAELDGASKAKRPKRKG